jgi:hypothetical protein
MRYSCEHCAATDIDASWRWCPECGAFPTEHPLDALSTSDEASPGLEWRVGASVLF